MKRIVFVLSILVTIICLMGCSQDASVQTGTLEININSDVSRGIQAISMETASYNVTIKDSSENVVFSSYGKTQTTYTVSVLAGTYTAYVEALNSDGDVIGTGSSTLAVVAGQVKSCSITVSELAGNGTFSIAITANEGYPLAYSIKSADGTEVEGGDLSYSNSRYTAAEELTNGFYTFIITRTDTNKVLKYDSVRIISGKAATYSATFQFLTDGSIVIINEITSTPSINITLSATTLKAEDTLTASATISGVTGEYTCFWTLDGVAITEAGAYSDLVLQMDEVEIGDHSIALFVCCGNVIWAQDSFFQMVPDRITSMTVSGDLDIWVIGDVLIPESDDLSIICNIGENRSIDLSSPFVHSRLFGVEECVLTCVLSDDAYNYYLESTYDESLERTVIYIIIDKFIENPHYINVIYDFDFEYPDYDMSMSSIGLRLGNNSGDSGLIVYLDDVSERRLKVEGGTYWNQGHAYCGNNVPQYIRASFDQEEITTSSSEIKNLTMRQEPISTINIAFPDSYDDYTSFIVVSSGRWGGNEYSLVNNQIQIMLAASESEDYLIYPCDDKDCYYTVSIIGQNGDDTVVATRHEAEFVDSGITSPGKFAVTYSSDCLVPSDMKIQVRVGDTYSDPRGIGWGSPYILGATDCLPIEVFAPCSENYELSFTSEETTVENETMLLVTIHISAKYDNYATVNVSYDFDFDIPTDQKTAVKFTNITTGEDYYLPVVSKTITEFKAIQGSYRRSGSFTNIRIDSTRYLPNSNPTRFSINNGESVDVSISMEVN